MDLLALTLRQGSVYYMHADQLAPVCSATGGT
jgi:hypothetical protein